MGGRCILKESFSRNPVISLASATAYQSINEMSAGAKKHNL